MTADMAQFGIGMAGVSQSSVLAGRASVVLCLCRISVVAGVDWFVCARQSSGAGYYSRISVLIAAYNEEEAIERKIQQTLALEYPADKLEVLVLSDCSTDRTDEIVKRFLTAVFAWSECRSVAERLTRRTWASRKRTGEVIIFSDATAIYHPKALLYLACNYQDAIGRRGERTVSVF